MLQLLLAIVALLIIAVTMLFSAADLELKGLRWHARRLAFVLAGAGAIGMLCSIFVGGWRPGGEVVSLLCGVAGVFVTNPFQIPWHKWIWKGSTRGIA